MVVVVLIVVLSQSSVCDWFVFCDVFRCLLVVDGLGLSMIVAFGIGAYFKGPWKYLLVALFGYT